MLKKMSYQDYKNKGYKLPFVAWLGNQVSLYVVLGLIAILMLGYIFYDGQKTIKNLNTPPTPTSSWADVKPQNTPGGIWATNFIKDAPKDVTNWKTIEDSSPTQPVNFNDCNSFSLLPTTVYSTFKAEGKEASLSVQLYGAGTANTSYQDYKKTFNNCWNTQTKIVQDTEISYYDHGEFFNIGDAIVFIKSNDKNLTDNLTSFYIDKAKTTLKESGCASFTEQSNDANRSLYYKDIKYSGYFVNDTVKTDVNYNNLPTMVLPTIKNKEYMSLPEAPLPDNFPQEPAAVQKPQPTKDVTLNTENFQKVITFQDPDNIGPGCGWAWSSQKAPIVNINELNSKKDKTYQDAKNLVDANAKQYISDKVKNAKDNMLVSQQIIAWNNYVKQTSEVHDKWRWLNDQRSQLQQPWETYVANHNNWINFDNIQANAAKDYNDAVTQCNNQNSAVQDWETKWRAIYEQQKNSNTPAPTPTPTVQPTSSSSATPSTSPTPTPTPTPSATVSVPPRPQECNNYPSRPAILDQSKPAEPQPPAIPDGVTIPNSWSQPITTPTVQKK